MFGGSISDVYLINKNREEIINDIYVILRPDKDDIANILFPGERVVYLRYDKPEDVKMIDKYNKLNDKKI